MKTLSLLVFFLLGPTLLGSELGAVTSRLDKPTVQRAKLVLTDLDKVIAEGDARTVTLATKMRRSVRRIFTAEYKMLEAKKTADEREAKAKQLEKNGQQWLKPNAHGRINKLGAKAAFEDARALRLKSKWAREELSREWREEIVDYEKMLGDLEFSKEEAALLTLAEVLSAIVDRTPWVDRPTVKYDGERVGFLRNRIANKDRWLLLARHASDAQDYELSYDFFRQAGSDLGRFRVGALLAARLVERGHVGSAINIWKRLGEEERAEALVEKKPTLGAEDYQVLSQSALARNVAPACVRVITPNGHQTGFFVRQGGYLVTCKYGLRGRGGEMGTLTVILEDGRALTAELASESDDFDLAVLKVDHDKHELLPVAKSEDLKAGQGGALFGFAERKENVPASIPATVLAASEEWRGQPISRLALDASRGHRGAPVVDATGRVLGMFLTSRTGMARAIQPGTIRDFVGQL